MVKPTMRVCITKEATAQQTFDHCESKRLVARDDEIQFPEFLHEDRSPFNTDAGAAAKKDAGTKEEETPLRSENKNNEEVDKNPETNEQPEKEETKPDTEDGKLEKNEMNDGADGTKLRIDAVERENDEVNHEFNEFNHNIDEQKLEEKCSKEWELYETSAIEEEEIHEIPKNQEEVIIGIDLLTVEDVTHVKKNIIEENVAEEVYVAIRKGSEDKKKLEITYRKSLYLGLTKGLKSQESAESESEKVDVNQSPNNTSKVEANNSKSKTTATRVSVLGEPEKIVNEVTVTESNDITESTLNNSKWIPGTTTSISDSKELLSATDVGPKNNSIQSTDNIKVTRDHSNLSDEFMEPNSDEIESFVHPSEPTFKHQTDIAETSTDLPVTSNNPETESKSVEVSYQRNPSLHQTENITLHDLKAQPIIIKLINEEDGEVIISQSDTPSNNEFYNVSEDPSQLENDVPETEILKDENLVPALDKVADACNGGGNETEEKGDTTNDSEIAGKESEVRTGADDHKESEEGVNEQSEKNRYSIENIKQEDGIETEIKMIETDDAIEEVEKPGQFYLDDHSSKGSLNKTDGNANTKVDESEKKGEVCKIIPQNKEEVTHDTEEKQSLEVKILEKEKEKEEKGNEQYVKILEDENSSRAEEFESKKGEQKNSEKENQKIETTHKPTHDGVLEKKSLELNDKEESKAIGEERFVEITPDDEEIMITELPVLQAQKVDIETVSDLTLLENNFTAGDGEHTLDNENLTESNEDSTEKDYSEIKLSWDEHSKVQSETQGDEDSLKRNKVKSISTETEFQKNKTDDLAVKDVISKEEYEATFVKNKADVTEKGNVENEVINGQEEGQLILPNSFDQQNHLKGEGIPSKVTEEIHTDTKEFERKKRLPNENITEPSDKQVNAEEENLANEQKGLISDEILEANSSESHKAAEKKHENVEKMLKEETEDKLDELLFDQKIEDVVNEHKSDTESKSEREERLSEKQEIVLEVDAEDVKSREADPNESGNTEDTDDLQGDLTFQKIPFPLLVRFNKASTFVLDVGRSVTVATPGHYVPETFFADTIVQGGTFQIPCGRAKIEKRKLTDELFKEITENRKYSATPAEEPQNEQNTKEVTESKIKPSKEIIITDKVDRSVQYSDNEESDRVSEDKMKKLPGDLTPKQVLENRTWEEDNTENVAESKTQQENEKFHENVIVEPLASVITEKSRHETDDGNVDAGDIEKIGEDSVETEVKEKPLEIGCTEQPPETLIEETYQKPVVSIGSREKEEPEKNIVQLKQAENEECKDNIVEILKEKEKELDYPVAEVDGESSGEKTPEETELDDHDLIDAVAKEQQSKIQNQDYMVPVSPQVLKDSTDVTYTEHELTSMTDNMISDIESSDPDKSDLQNEVKLRTTSVVSKILKSV